MMQRKSDPDLVLLAGFADGELDAVARDRVEARLASSPDAAAEVEAQRRMTRLCQATPPPEPSEAAWAGVQARILAETRRKAPALRRGPGGWGRWLAGLSASAVAAGLVFALVHGFRPEIPTDGGEAMPVVAHHEVEIISIDDADTVALVVGEPPVRGPIVLASAGEVTLETPIPDLRMEDAPNPPMLWVPVDGDSEDKRE